MTDAVNGVIEIAIAKTDTALYPGRYCEQPAGHSGHQQRHVLDRANPGGSEPVLARLTGPRPINWRAQPAVPT